jgi:hypothetical protein
MAPRPTLLRLSLLVGLLSITACGSATGGNGGTAQNVAPNGTSAAAGATVDPSNVSQLLMLAHAREPQDVTYVLTATDKTAQGAAQGSGKAILTRSPRRYLIDIQYPAAPSLNLHQIYDYDSKKITSTVQGQTTSGTTNIEAYYLLHNPVYMGKEQVNGADAYHVSGTLFQEQTGIATHLWIRVSDLYVVKSTQHVEGSGLSDDRAYTNPVFNSGATIPAP